MEFSSSAMVSRHGVNSIPELDLIGNSRIGMAYLNKNVIGIDQFRIEVCYHKKSWN